MFKYFCLLLFSIMLFSETRGAILHVPGTYANIQSAINAAQTGDTVLVDPGTYFENIDFSGKRIIVASDFLLTHTVSDIEQTIIDGSQPSRPDTASVVLFVHGEDSSSVLMGFTLTGGTGTVWRDIHNGNLYREGGGILCELSSPTIRNNFIVKNDASKLGGVSSSGGGGIRCGDGNPRILNNYIAENRGRYGGGIVLNYTGAIIKNNVVYKNSGGEDYGGSGIWVNNNGAHPKIIENNTVTENTSVLDGGGILVQSTTVTIRNTIVWGNVAPADSQIGIASATVSVTYSDVQGGSAGTGNIALAPQFNDTSHYLLPSSPCIDAGDASSIYDDPADTLNPGFARWPSKGSLRNDMGAFGGPGADATVYNDIHQNDPLPPSGLSAYSDYQTPTSIVLHWIDPSTAVNGTPLANFKIHLYRDSVFIAEIDSGMMNFTDTGLINHHFYSYMARTIVPLDSGTTSSASSYAGGNAKPQRPSAFLAGDGEDGAHLSWTNPTRQIDGTPLNDFGAVLIYRDGMLIDSLIQTSADTGLIRSYIDTTRGYHWHALRTRDTEHPTNFSDMTDSILAFGRFGTEYHEDFENGTSSVYRSNLWDTTRAISYSGIASLTDSPDGNSPTGTMSYVFLPPVLLTNESVLKFQQIVIVNPATSVASVEISSNNRQSFKSLATYNWNSYARWSDGTADSGDWKQVSLDVSSYLNDTVTVRLRLVTTFGPMGDGWYVDSINLNPINPIVTQSYLIDSLWNLLSLPLKTDQHRRMDIYPSSISSAFAFAGSYVSIDSLAPGHGFWMKFDSSTTVEITGRTVTHDSILLNTGWNLVGALTTPMDSSAVRTKPPGILSSPFFGFHGQYSQASTLVPGNGYWVRAKQPGALILRPTFTARSLASVVVVPPSSKISNANQLAFTDAGGRTQSLTFEFGDAKSPLETFDLPPTPPEGLFDVRFATQRSHAVVTNSAPGDVGISLQGIHYPLIVSWKMSESDSAAWSFIWDSHNIRLQGIGVAVLDHPAHQVALRPLSGEIKNIPQHYSLYQNYPNPFNPTTIIRFDLPEQSHVALKVYNVLGELVRVLAENTTYEAGSYQEFFDATALANGVYFFRLEATSIDAPQHSFTEVKKMLLIR